MAVATAAPTFIIERQLAGKGSAGFTSDVSTYAPFTPAEIDQAYGISGLSFSGISGNGAGQTIALVDAYNDPNLVSDAAVFDANFGLTAFNVSGGPTLTVLGQTGSPTSLPTNASPGGWDVEESLDVQWAHSVAPAANIVMFEANSATDADLLTAVSTAANYPGVSAVSMSWGGNEFSGEQSDDSVFHTPAAHQGVTFLASTGDSGAPGEYPADSPDVVAVGGTSLAFNSSGGYGSETGWSEGGGGISTYETQPTYQAGKVNGLSSTQRTIPDVSMDADPNTGVDVYDSYDNGWFQVGGTSLSAPLWAGLIAIANQGRVQSGLGTLDGPTQTLPALYSASSSMFHDVTSGSNGYSAGPGYDLVTGLGTPVAGTLVPALAGTSSSATHLVFAQQPTSTTAGSTISPGVSVLVENASGSVITSDQSSVTLQISAGPSGATLGGTATVTAVNGVATFGNLSLNTAGAYSFLASDGNYNAATSAAFTVSPAAVSQLFFTQEPTSTAPGTPISPAVKVAVEDAYGNLASNLSSTVSITLANGPAGAMLGGTTSVTTTTGLASFSNLTLNQVGTYQLLASEGVVSSATISSIFDVSGATKVVFTGHPGSGVAGQTLASSSVAVENAAGIVVGADSSNVTLSIASGPAGGALTGTSTVAAASGVATFTNLAFTIAGSYTLVATDGTLASATTSAIIISGTSAKLGFGVQPAAGVVGAAFSPGVTVDVLDSGGNLLGGDSSAVTLLLASGPVGATLGGTVTVAAVNGVATFATPWLNKPGTYTLRAADGSLSQAVSASFTISGPDMLNVLAPFNTTNGGNPLGGVHLDSGGNLWGTTQQGGAYGEGTVFEVAAGSNKITNFFSFNGTDGDYPWTSLTADAQGNLYGTTSGGGAYGDGTLFEIPKGSSALNTLVSFNSADGSFSRTDLLLDPGGNLWGTNSQGGAYGYGTLFEVPAGSQTVVVRCAFTSSDAYPQGPLVMDSSGNLFGTTGASGSTTFGSIYELPAGSYTPVILYSFTSSNYGPTGLVADSAGDLFGTTEYPKGTIFEIPRGSAVQYTVPTALYQFANYNTYPGVLSIDRLGDLFGTTEPALGTGSTTNGVVYELKPGASTIATLVSFSGANGTWPTGNLAIDSSGDLFGATNAGGTGGAGEVYELQAPHLVFTGQPASGPIGAPISPSVLVSLEDANGNVVADNSGVTLSLGSGPAAGALGGTLTEPLVNGVATFSNLTLTPAGTYTLAASDGIDGSAVSAAFTEASGFPGVAASLQFVQQPTSTPAGAPIAPAVTVEVLDGYGNVVTGDISTVTLSLASSPAGGTLGGTVTAAAVNGIATFSNLVLSAAGTYTLLAADSSLTVATSSNVVITPLHLVFATEPTSTTAGTAFNPAVVIDVDTASGAVDTADNSSVTLSINGRPSGGTLLGTTTVKVVRGVATFSNVALSLVGTYTLNAADGSWAGVVSSPFAISPAAVASLAFVQQPGRTGVGSTFQPAVTVELLDAYGNLATTDTSTVTLAIDSGPAGATLSGTTSVQPVNGIATFGTVSLNTAGTYTLGATDGSAVAAVSPAFTVYQSVTTQLAFGVQPSTTVLGGDFAAAITVKVEDQNGNVMTGDSSVVTLSLANGPNGGSVGGALTESAVNGVATFPSVFFTDAGTYQLRASDGSLTSAISSAFGVTGSYTLQNMYTFSGSVGSGLSNPVLDSAGDLFFGSSQGGAAFGQIFEMPAGSSTPSVLASFNSANGSNAQSLTLDAAGDLYGTTQGGGAYGNGVVFEIAKGASNIVDLASLHNASGGPAGSKMLLLDAAGDVYGTSVFGGSANLGYVWEIAKGSGVATTLASFTASSGAYPQGGLVMDTAGNLYGTTVSGGAYNTGTIFELPAGSGAINTLVSMTGAYSYPSSNLVIDSLGDLTGTAGPTIFFYFRGGGGGFLETYATLPSPSVQGADLIQDGSGDDFVVSGEANGGVFEHISGSGPATALRRFDGFDGAYPSGIAMDAQSDIFGTTTYGGNSSYDATNSPGNGNVYEMRAPHLVLATPPSNITAGTPVTATIDVDDVFGNVISSDSSSLAVAVSGPSGSSNLFKAVDGVLNYSDATATTAGSYFFIANDTGVAGANVIIANFTIASGAAAKVVFARQPTSITAGQTMSAGVTVDVEDAYGNLTTTGSSTVTLSLKSGTGTLLGTVSAAVVNGVATFSNLSLDNVGTFTLSAADGQLTAGTSSAFTVTPAAAAAVAFVQQPTSTNAEAVIQPAVTVELLDAYGNEVTSSTAAVTLAVASGPAGGGLSGTLSVAAVGGLATFSGLAFTAAGTYTLSASGIGLTAATSAAVTITPDKLVFFTAPGGAIVGGGLGSSVVVDVESPSGTLISSDESSVTLSVGSGPVGGTLGGNVTVAAVNGIATFPAVYFNIGGTYTLTATDGTLPPVTSSVFTVAGSYARKQLMTFTGVNGANPTGSPVTDSAGDLYFTSATGGASNLGAVWKLPVGASSPVVLASFASTSAGSAPQGMIIDSIGDLFGITRSGGTFGDGVVFEIPAGTATLNVLAQLPNPVTEPYGGHYLLLDSSGDLYGAAYSGGGTSNDGYVWEIVAGSGVLTQLAPLTDAQGYQPETDVVMDAAGNLYGTTSAGGPSGGGSIFELPRGGAALVTLASFSGYVSGTSYAANGDLLIDAKSNLFGTAYGNVFELAKGSSTINVLSSFPSYDRYTSSLLMDANGNLFGDTSGGSSYDDGTVFEIPAGTTAIKTLAAFNGVDGLFPTGLTMDGAGNLFGVTVSGGNANFNLSGNAIGYGTVYELEAPHLSFIQQPQHVTAGSTFTPALTVTYSDAFGNLITTENPTVTLNLSGPGGGALLGTATATVTSGLALFGDLSVRQAGTYTLQAGDGLNAAVIASSNAITINPAAASQLVFSQQPTAAIAGSTIAPAVTIDVEDAYGNVVTSDSSGVSLDAVSSPFALLGTTTATAVDGVATFSNLSIQRAGSYTLQAFDGRLSAATSGAFTVTPAAAAQLVFSKQPSNGTAGSVLPAVVVDVEDAFGNVETGDDLSVTLSVASGPGLLGGTTTVAAVAGVATFSTLSLDAQGLYALAASDAALPTITSAGFWANPISTTSTLTPLFTGTPYDTQAMSFSMAVQGGVPDGETVTLDLANTFQVLATTTTSNGTASFTLPAGTLTAGSFRLLAVYGGDSLLGSSNSNVVDLDVQVAVTGVTVNGNSAALAGVQRSMVDSIVYMFAEPVALAATNAFDIALHAGKTGTVPTLSWTAINPNNLGFATQWAITFSGAGVAGRSIADGVYDLSLVAGAAVTMGGSFVTPPAAFTFDRLFGDLNGDGLVNNADYARFGRAFGASVGNAAYQAAFDYNGDGVINNYDYAQFGRRFGLSFTY